MERKTKGKEESSSNSGVIAGATIGVLALLLLAVLAFLFWRRQKKRDQRRQDRTTSIVLEDSPIGDKSSGSMQTYSIPTISSDNLVRSASTSTSSTYQPAGPCPTPVSRMTSIATRTNTSVITEVLESEADEELPPPTYTAPQVQPKGFISTAHRPSGSTQ